MTICFGTYVGYSWSDMSNHVFFFQCNYHCSEYQRLAYPAYAISIYHHLRFVILVDVSQTIAIKYHVVLLEEKTYPFVLHV